MYVNVHFERKWFFLILQHTSLHHFSSHSLTSETPNSYTTCFRIQMTKFIGFWMIRRCITLFCRLPMNTAPDTMDAQSHTRDWAIIRKYLCISSLKNIIILRFQNCFCYCFPLVFLLELLLEFTLCKNFSINHESQFVTWCVITKINESKCIVINIVSVNDSK